MTGETQEEVMADRIDLLRAMAEIASTQDSRRIPWNVFAHAGLQMGMTLAEVHEILTDPGEMFELEIVDGHGQFICPREAERRWGRQGMRDPVILNTKAYYRLRQQGH